MSVIQDSPKQIALKAVDQLDKLKERYLKWEQSLPLIQQEQQELQVQEPIVSASPVVEPPQTTTESVALNSVSEEISAPVQTNADVISNLQSSDVKETSNNGSNYSDNDEILKIIESIQKENFDYFAYVDTKLEELANKLSTVKSQVDIQEQAVVPNQPAVPAQPVVEPALDAKKEELFNDFGIGNSTAAQVPDNKEQIFADFNVSGSVPIQPVPPAQPIQPEPVQQNIQPEAPVNQPIMPNQNISQNDISGNIFDNPGQQMTV